jgi:hypothetical protein
MLVLEMVKIAGHDPHFVSAANQLPGVAVMARVARLVRWIRVVVDQPDVHNSVPSLNARE